MAERPVFSVECESPVQADRVSGEWADSRVLSQNDLRDGFAQSRLRSTIAEPGTCHTTFPEQMPSAESRAAEWVQAVPVVRPAFRCELNRGQNGCR